MLPKTPQEFYKEKMKIISFLNQFQFTNGQWQNQVGDLICKGYTIENLVINIQ
jgi:hypothetical protein